MSNSIYEKSCICLHCNQPVHYSNINASWICTNHPLLVYYECRRNGELEFELEITGKYYIIDYNDTEFVMFWIMLKKGFRLYDYHEYEADILNLDYLPDISPEQALDKLKLFLNFS